MTLSDSDPTLRPADLSEAKTMPAGSADDTLVAPAFAAPPPPADVPPPPAPPPSGPTPSSPPPGPNYSVQIMVGVFVLALVGLGLLGLGIVAVMRLNGGSPPASGPATATRVPLPSQVVLVPTTTSMPTASTTPSEAPTATGLPATATATGPVSTTIAATRSTTPTQASNLLTVDLGANIRSGPGVIYTVVGTIKAGDTAPVIGRDVSNNWLVISFKGGFGGKGWIAGSVVTYNGDKSKLPLVAAPPPPPPTATPKPAGNPNGGLVTGAHGVSGMLNLCSPQVTFAVGERVCFVEWIKNETDHAVAYGILGVQAVNLGGGVQFQTSWSGQQAPGGLLGIDPGCTGPTDRCKGQWEDGMRLNSPGTYHLALNVCFSDFPTCRGTSGAWEVLSGPIEITVQ